MAAPFSGSQFLPRRCKLCYQCSQRINLIERFTVVPMAPCPFPLHLVPTMECKFTASLLSIPKTNRMLDRHGLTRKPSDGDLSRRNRYGVGPTVRYSADAHEIIMGPQASLNPPRLSSLPKPVKPITQASFASRLSRPTAASAARAAESKKSLIKPCLLLQLHCPNLVPLLPSRRLARDSRAASQI
jgi:hypothetical protein